MILKPSKSNMDYFKSWRLWQWLSESPKLNTAQLWMKLRRGCLRVIKSLTEKLVHAFLTSWLDDCNSSLLLFSEKPPADPKCYNQRSFSFSFSSLAVRFRIDRFRFRFWFWWRFLAELLPLLACARWDIEQKRRFEPILWVSLAC